MRPDRLRAVERTGEVHPQVALPELGLLIAELAEVVECPGVVDQDVDRAELGDRPSHRFVDLCALGYVALDCGRAPSQLADLLRRRLGVDEALRARGLRDCAIAGGVVAGVRLDLDVGNHDVCAGAAQRQRVGPAEPA